MPIRRQKNDEGRHKYILIMTSCKFNCHSYTASVHHRQSRPDSRTWNDRSVEEAQKTRVTAIERASRLVDATRQKADLPLTFSIEGLVFLTDTESPVCLLF